MRKQDYLLAALEEMMELAKTPPAKKEVDEGNLPTVSRSHLDELTAGEKDILFVLAEAFPDSLRSPDITNQLGKTIRNQAAECAHFREEGYLGPKNTLRSLYLVKMTPDGYRAAYRMP